MEVQGGHDGPCRAYDGAHALQQQALGVVQAIHRERAVQGEEHGPEPGGGLGQAGNQLAGQGVPGGPLHQPGDPGSGGHPGHRDGVGLAQHVEGAADDAANGQELAVAPRPKVGERGAQGGEAARFMAQTSEKHAM